MDEIELDELGRMLADAGVTLDELENMVSGLEFCKSIGMTDEQLVQHFTAQVAEGSDAPVPDVYDTAPVPIKGDLPDVCFNNSPNEDGVEYSGGWTSEIA